LSEQNVHGNWPGGKCAGNITGRNVCLDTQDYKSLRVAPVICAILVNTQTHISK